MYDNSLSDTYSADNTNYTIDNGYEMLTIGFQSRDTIRFSSIEIKNFTFIEANNYDYTTDYDVV